MEEWTAALENGDQINTIYVDFEKAFDKVPRHLLLKKLQSYNFGIWTSFLCTFVPGCKKSTERTFTPVELSFRGTFAPGE